MPPTQPTVTPPLPEWTPEEAPRPQATTATPTWQPTPTWGAPETPVVETPFFETTTALVTPAPVKPKEAPITVPFWQRSLQVFAAPFVWVDENVIKPGLAMAATGIGAIEEVKRKPGEDYFEWKKRSWAEWKAPGFDLNVPWSDEPARVDLRGVLELAPWLLIPGAGQVGAGARAARGVAGILGKMGTAGRVLGTAVEYSPWGMVEKTAGAAIRRAGGAVGKTFAEAQRKVGERIVGKIPEPIPPTPFEAKFTKFFGEEVFTARKAFEKELPALRERQFQAVEDIFARVRRGEITATEGTALAEKATAGGIKAGFAIKAPVTPKGTALEVTTAIQAQAMKRDIGTLGKIVDDRAYRRALGGGTEFWDEAVYNQLKAGKSITVFRAAPIEEKSISLGDRVTHTEASARAVFDEMYLSTEGRILKATATADDLIPQLPGEFLFVKAGTPIKAIPEVGVGIGRFTAKEVDEGLNKIVMASENGLVARDSAIAFRDLVMTGALPEPHHLRDFSMVFGEDFAKAAGKFARLPLSTKDKILDLLNLPRAVLASGDLSATFRQGLILLLTHPEKAPRAFWRQLKGFASEKISLEMDDALRAHPLYQNAVRDGIEFTPIRKGAKLFAKEEPFTSNIAQHLPMVRRSERAFTTFLNEMRMGTYEASAGVMAAQGATAAQMKLMANFINIGSGRGTLPANMNRYAPILNTVLFSARYQMSTLQLPRQLGRMLISKNPYMRKEAAKALITFVGGGSALLGLFQTSGVGKVAVDPRSGDFGKLVVGDTRLDIWRGYVQYARFVAQLLTGERKSAYGNLSKTQRSEIASRFLQSKASPAFGLMVDLLKGENFMGEPIFNETTGFIKTARDRLLPLALQDVIDAMEQSGVNGIWTAAPATMGIGVLTYVDDLVRVKGKIARNMGYQTWGEIDPKTQRQIENTSVELQTAYIEFDRRVMGTAWGDWRVAGKAVEDVFKENVDLATAQYRQTGDGYQFRKKIGDAFTARRGGYAAREADARFEEIVKRLKMEDTAEAMIALGPEQLAIKIYNDALYGDDMYDEFGDYKFDEAEMRKQQLRQQLGQEMFDYIEEYRGLKYGDLPPEFGELVKARMAMRPYWQIRDEVEDIYGKPRTKAQESYQNSAISKLRKRLRELDPTVEKYYQMFYVRA